MNKTHVCLTQGGNRIKHRSGVPIKALDEQSSKIAFFKLAASVTCVLRLPLARYNTSNKWPQLIGSNKLNFFSNGKTCSAHLNNPSSRWLSVKDFKADCAIHLLLPAHPSHQERMLHHFSPSDLFFSFEEEERAYSK